MTVATFKGIELNTSPYSALLIEAAMEGQADSSWVELFAMILFSKDHFWVPQWTRIFKSQLTSTNSFVRYSVHCLLSSQDDEGLLDAASSDASWLVRAAGNRDYFLYGTGESFWTLSENEQVLLCRHIHIPAFAFILATSPIEKLEDDHILALIEQVFPEESQFEREIGNTFWSDFDNWGDMKKITDLWKCITRFSIRVQNLLIKRLPLPDDSKEETLKSLFLNLSISGQNARLRRSKVNLVDFRRDKFLGSDQYGAGAALSGKGGQEIAQQYLENWGDAEDDIKKKLSEGIEWMGDSAIIERVFLFELTYEDENFETDVERKYSTRDSICAAIRRIKERDPLLYDVLYLRVRLIRLALNWVAYHQEDAIREQDDYRGDLAPLLTVFSLKKNMLEEKNPYQLYKIFDSYIVPREVLAEMSSSVTEWFEEDPIEERQQAEHGDIDGWKRRFKEIERQYDDVEFDSRTDIEKAVQVSQTNLMPIFKSLGESLSGTRTTSLLTFWGIVIILVVEFYRAFWS